MSTITLTAYNLTYGGWTLITSSFPSGTTFANIIGATGGASLFPNAYTYPQVNLNTRSNSTYTNAARSYIGFDTSPIPVGSTVTAATLRILNAAGANTSAYPLEVVIVDSSYAGNLLAEGLTLREMWDSTGTMLLSDTKKLFTDPVAWDSFDFNSDGLANLVAAGQYYCVAMISESDRIKVDPVLGASKGGYRSYYDPAYLDITYTPPPPDAPSDLTAACVSGIGESTLPEAPEASFTCDVYSGTVPLTVNITDRSANTPTSWNYDFGDGTSATSQHPTHTYTQKGTYVIRQTVTNAYGSSRYEVTIIAEQSVTADDDGTPTSVVYDFPREDTITTYSLSGWLDIDVDWMGVGISKITRLDIGGDWTSPSLPNPLTPNRYYRVTISGTATNDGTYIGICGKNYIVDELGFGHASELHDTIYFGPPVAGSDDPNSPGTLTFQKILDPNFSVPVLEQNGLIPYGGSGLSMNYVGSGCFPGIFLQTLLGQVSYYTCDTENDRVKSHTASGSVLKQVGSRGTGTAQFHAPTTCAAIHGRQLIDRVKINED